MIKLKFIIISFGIIFLITNCSRTLNIDNIQAEPPEEKHYISIYGLWRVTPETAIKYPHGTLEPIIHIMGGSSVDLSAQGCFLWERRYYDNWEIDSIQYIDSTNLLTVYFDKEGVYKASVDNKRKVIHGIVSWSDEDDTAELDFVRDDDIDDMNFFVPFPAHQDGSINYTYHKPETYKDQIKTASIFNFIRDTSAFYNIIERIIKQEYGRLESFLIIKDNKLVLEEYYYGYDKSKLHYLNSCTKSIVSILLGIALDRNNCQNTDQPILNFFPQFASLYDHEKEKITLKHVLTMTSGINSQSAFEGNEPEEFIKYLLELPLESNPGEKFTYSAENTNLLGGIIYTLENKQADDFAKEVLFNKLGISEFDWERENGIIPCDAGLYMYPRDMAKIGLLVLNNGIWNSEQIVSKEWINISTKPHVAESAYFNYGFQWWHRSKQNSVWWNNSVRGGKTEHDMILALGHGGQFIMIIRDLNIAIVMTSSDNNESNKQWLKKIPLVIEDLLPLFE